MKHLKGCTVEEGPCCPWVAGSCTCQCTCDIIAHGTQIAINAIMSIPWTEIDDTPLVIRAEAVSAVVKAFDVNA